MHLVQAGALLALVTFLLWCAAPAFPPSLEETLGIAEALGWESSFLFMGVASLVALLAIVPAVRWRVGHTLRREFGLERLSAPETLWVVAAVVPLGILSDQVYLWGVQATLRLAEQFPVLRLVPQIDSIQIVQRQMAQTPYPILLMAIALAPALSEEFVFRGLIGRGLIARWGVPGGVLLTSLLFAAAHGTPAHALATFPVGLYLHFVYRTTGKLWAPILLHGLQNGLSVTLMKLQTDPALPASAPLIWASAGYLTVVAALLRETSPGRSLNDAPVVAPPIPAPPLPTWPAHRSPMVRRRRPVSVAPSLATCSIVTYTAVLLGTQLIAR